MTPKTRKEFYQYNRDWERNLESRWTDHNADQKLSAVLFDLVEEDNEHARSIRNHAKQNSGKVPTDVLQSAPPFEKLNDLFKIGMLTVSLKNSKGGEIHARRGSDGATFSMAQMSDGERNAAIIAATALTIEPGTILLIDEPERHLHRAIIEPFLSALFKQRDDCIFIVSTHEIALPVANPEACVLMVRSCRWNGENGNAPNAWDIEVLEPNAELSEDLKRAILGARRRILFVEGDLSSPDQPLYGALFPDLSVMPVGGCGEVVKAVKGLREAQSHHYTEAFGLIDRDDRTKGEVDRLAQEGVFALDVCSVEALYYCSDAIEAVARKQSESLGCDADNMADSAKQAALDAIRNDADLPARMAARRCARHVHETMLAEIPDWKKIKDGKDQKITVCVDSPYPTELKRFQKLVAKENLDALVARYPLRESNVFKGIVKTLECRSRSGYEQIVVTQVRGDTALAGQLKRRIGPLCRALGEA